jgi:hypothetical protein
MKRSRVVKVLDNSVVFDSVNNIILLGNGNHKVRAVTDDFWFYVSVYDSQKLKALRIPFISGAYDPDNGTFTRIVERDRVQLLVRSIEDLSLKIGVSSRLDTAPVTELNNLCKLLNNTFLFKSKRLFAHPISVSVEGVYPIEIYHRIPGEAAYVSLIHNSLGELSVFAEISDGQELKIGCKERYPLI